MSKLLKLGVSLLLLNSTCLYAADKMTSPPVEAHEQTDSWVDKLLNKLGADGGFDDTKAIDFSILPGPFYGPETSLGLGISAIGLYQVDKQDRQSQLSSAVINGFASVNGSLGVKLENRTFLSEDSWRFYFDGLISDSPEVYYGVGYPENHQDDNKIVYKNRQFSVAPLILKRVASGTYLGAGFDVNYAKARDINVEESKIDPSPLAKSNLAMGVKLQASYDTRDVLGNPYEGRLLQLDTGFYMPELGSQQRFQSIELNYSEYMQMGPRNSVLAWQLRGRFTHGNVPWHMLSQVGGGSELRGYTAGRYRDKQMLMGQLEYRWDLPGRHGVVAWTGVGAVAPSVRGFNSSELLPNVGIGYRFEVKTRANLRLDLGFGDGETGFYFNLNEAF
ncbi:BamA/TamA family outer membrane protein [Paraferrimonas sedimenticola]|uniref:Membrane protein n=1 Tax=Paraferrimonas sedimenticola TaxID=375674 RepID=A0AA37RW25_9GAMM|nr:BamA/TamA family outer membrane protein [Paraferrimonas sedimenticola]GLP96390.1 membrane protein [Paraferrimonas sedimenticola]